MRSTGVNTEREAALAGTLDIPLLRAEALAELGDVQHGFTTRGGGCAVGPLATLNLAVRAGARRTDVEENWRRVLAAVCGSAEAPLALVDQVHGDEVLRASEPSGPLATLGSADALVTTVVGLAVAVRTADCVPVLLAAPGGVAAVHAGWRGVVAGVVPAAVRALCAASGAVPADVRAAVGPHIGVAAYEVGDEVVAALEGAGLPREVVSRPGPRGRLHADLGASVERQLRGAGLGRVEHIGVCTHSDARMYSHRRDGSHTGRQAAVIARCG